MKTAKDYFNKSADQWDKPRRVAMANSVSEAIRKNIPLSKTMTAMEFGCGTGLISMALADLDTEDGGFHGDIPDVFHQGFDRKELGRMLERKGLTDISAATAHVMIKESATTGKPAEFPVFLITAKKDRIS